MKTFVLFLFLFCMSEVVLAQEPSYQFQSEDKQLTITLLHQPCSNEVAKQALKDYFDVDKGLDAVVVFKDKQIKACWAFSEEKEGVIIVDETMKGGVFDSSQFKEAPAL